MLSEGRCRCLRRGVRSRNPFRRKTPGRRQNAQRGGRQVPALMFVLEMGWGRALGQSEGNLAPLRETDASLCAGDHDSEPDVPRAGCYPEPSPDTADLPAAASYAAHCWRVSGCKITDPDRNHRRSQGPIAAVERTRRQPTAWRPLARSRGARRGMDLRKAFRPDGSCAGAQNVGTRSRSAGER